MLEHLEIEYAIVAGFVIVGYAAGLPVSAMIIEAARIFVIGTAAGLDDKALSGFRSNKTFDMVLQCRTNAAALCPRVNANPIQVPRRASQRRGPDAGIGTDDAIGFDHEQDVVAAIDHAERDAHFFVRESSAVGQHGGHGVTVRRLEWPDDHAHSISLWMKSFHCQPASTTAREIPTSGEISGFGFTSSTRGRPPVSSRMSTRKRWRAPTAFQAPFAAATISARNSGAMSES